MRSALNAFRLPGVLGKSLGRLAYPGAAASGVR
jgi:hypothetical protein